MDDDLIILPGYNGTIGVFVDGTPYDGAALFLTKRSHVRSAAAEADPQRRSSSYDHVSTPFSTSSINR